jgi:hypothetical protein
MIPNYQDEQAVSAKPGSLNVDSLYLLLATMIQDQKNRVSDAFASRDRATELNHKTMLEQIRTTAQDVKEKFANTNEWRMVVNDLIGKKVDREVVDGLLARVERLESAKNQKLESHREGSSNVNVVVSIVSALAVIIGLFIAYGSFHH